MDSGYTDYGCPLLVGGPGDDDARSDGSLFGGPGRDVLRVGGSGYVDAGEGADDVAYVGVGGEIYIEAREGDDRISLGATAGSTSYLGPGDDIVQGDEGNDGVYAGSGSDTVWTYAGDDYVSGITPGDHVRTGSGNDTLVHGFNDSPSRAYAGSGDDTVWFYSWPNEVADAFIDGGSGQDTLVFEQLGVDEVGAGIIVDLTAGTATHDGNTYTVPGFDHALGSRLNDEMYGNSSDNSFIGLPGRDIMVGESGDDELVGKGNQDSANGGPGTDRCEAEITVDCEEQRTR